jgi:hypothetical protein
MNGAVGIETGTGASATAVQSQVLPRVNAHSAGWSSAAAATGTSDAASDAESFRSRLQSIMASLNTGLSAPGEEGAETDRIGGASQSTQTKTAANASAATAASTSGSSLAWGRRVGQVGGLAPAATQPGPKGSRDESHAARKAGSDASSRSLTSVLPIVSSSGKQVASSSKAAKKEGASDGTKQGLATVSVANIPLTAPVPGTAVSSANTVGAKPQASLAGRLAMPPTESAVQANSAGSRVTGTAGKSALTVGNPPARAESTLAAERGAAPGGDSNENDLSAAGGAGGSTAGEQAPSSGRTGALTEGALPTPALSQNPIHLEPGALGTIEDAAASLGGERVNRGAAAADSASFQSSAALSSVGKAALASAKRTSEQVASRTSHGAGAAEQAEYGNHSGPVQLTGQAADPSTLVRDPVGAHQTTNAIGSNTGSSTGTASGSRARETFSALDADAGPGTPSWIHAGAQRAEAGFQDPALGWVGVRADMSGGGVHAALVPGSAEASQTLGGHMAGLNAYLAAEHSPVETVTLAMPEGRGAALGADQGSGQSMYQGSGQNAGQGGSSESPSNSQPSAPAGIAAAIPDGSAQTSRLSATTQAVRLDGAHISVMA